ncbi:MAG: hypothetical protein R3B47_02925 [Bacteroidia bacterium]
MPVLDSLPYPRYVNFPSTSLEELKDSFSLKVLPNPASDHVKMSFNLIRQPRSAFSYPLQRANWSVLFRLES